MSKTRRLSYRLHEGEALIVGPIDHFLNMVDIYNSLADMDEYSDSEKGVWRELAAWVTEWLDKTAQVGELDE